MAGLFPETLSALEQKHPPAHPDSNLSSLLPPPGSPVSVSEAEAARAVQGFPKGLSAGGLNRLS